MSTIGDVLSNPTDDVELAGALIAALQALGEYIAKVKSGSMTASDAASQIKAMVTAVSAADLAADAAGEAALAETFPVDEKTPTP